MYAARVAKPKLSLNIASAAGTKSLSLPSPASLAIPRTPLSPGPCSPTALNTTRNARMAPACLTPRHQPTYAYANSSSTKSILKKNPSSHSGVGKRIQIKGEPTVHCVTPIENPDEYYGSYVKMSREERRWSRMS